MKQEQLSYNDLPQAVSLLLKEVGELKSLLKAKDEFDFESRQEDLVDVKGAAKILGMTPGGIYHKVFKKELPYIKLANSNRVRFSRRDLRQWLESGKRQAA